MGDTTGRCSATTAAGQPCRRWACRSDADFCTDHSPGRDWSRARQERRERLRELVGLLDVS